MKRLDFPDQKLPNGLNDCRLQRYAVDYVRRGGMFILDIMMSPPDSDDDPVYKTAKLLFTGLVFCSLDAPDGKSEFNERELWVPGVFVLELEDLKKKEWNTWVEPGEAWAFALGDLGAYLFVAAKACRFEWETP